MRRLSWLPGLLLWLCATAPAAAGISLPERNFSPAQAQRLNIVLITADDLGKSLGAYGDPMAQTPNLDALAAQGVLFERAWVSQASCSSSRASMLTGLYPHQHGQIGLAGQHEEFRLRPGLATLPGLLRSAGYFNGIIGKLHIDPPAAFPFDRRWNDQNGAIESRDVRRVARVAGDFVRQRGTKPFFLYVNYFDPHRPYDSDADQFLGLPAAPYTAADVTPLPFLGIDSPQIRSEVASYYNGISRLDTGVGLLLQELKRAGVLDRTVVVFVSDHGAPFSRAKTTAYEAGVAVPLIIHWPGTSRAGLRSEALVSTVDLMPTLLEAARIAPPRTEGRSLRPLLGGNTPAQWRGVLFAEYNAHAPEHFYPRRAVRTARYKLIHNLDSACRNPLSYIGNTRLSPTVRPAPGWNPTYRNLFQPPEFELYDLRNDPFETSNLAQKPTQAQRLGNMQAALMQWRQRTGDPLLNPGEIARLKSALGVGCVSRR
ncbi:MAG TPA: hypothetical protein DCP75_18715 [Haliea salexigens]|jgi:N-sulfoglucosamine sulfohydrolase|uniref:Sulfatase N-terminal domain-containing protein n=1 Tax=Haliea salexigens TaxID=287487 RepID=A0A3C1KTS8_9GAMM|nr:hypothetical protein [Haliea sp.]HAN29714.1 hypothetical protein [Haliea salexigens]HAN67086.1 hypothetical protein [Halieaceae bacterium]|tara:strand:+ start:416 stop:1870 length:1455 start_codon:yes stop_codon:yes gene_type:complete